VTETARSRTRALHPLEPLTAAEVGRAAELVKGSGQVGERPRFVQVSLHEPPKAALAGYEAGGHVEREALAVVLDRATGTTYEALVSLSDDRVRSCQAIDGVQPPIQIEEFLAAEEVVKQNPDWQQALRRRGITDFELVQVDPWVTGHFGLDVEEGRRLVRAVSYVRDRPDDNGYARPIEGVIAFVDLNRGEVARVEDHGVVPLPAIAGRYDGASVGPLREAPRPLEITQPDGPSFSVDGHEVSWQRWRFRLSLHPTEGLVLHAVGYEDGGRLRPVLHRAALSEMVVPYGETSPMHAWKSAFDAGEYGLGKLTNPLELGCDCVGEVVYFDGVVVSEDGEAVTIPNAICMHEEDYGILWKHTDYVTEQSEVRRSRRLVVSAIHTVGNYDYGFFWYFYQDGTLQLELKLTGIPQTMAVEPGAAPEHSVLLAPGLAAPHHQHLFNFRLDFDVDGAANSVYEVDAEPVPPGPGNPLGNAFVAKHTLLRREAEARRTVDYDRARYWLVTNPDSRTAAGQPVGYRLVPGHAAARLLAHPDSSVARRAAFARHNLWVTPYAPEERHAAGDYPNQHPGGDGLPAWTAADRPLENTDVVLWYTFGVTHIGRPEDWPVMPVEYVGFTLRPSGFFDRNPAIDVPPSAHSHD
jgi:primary-amine oxidase